MLVLFSCTCLACDTKIDSLVQKVETRQEEELIKVRIYFTDGVELSCYIKDLGIDKNAAVYVGGSSRNYIYDKDGKITGSYNYQRVLYIEILEETDGE